MLGSRRRQAERRGERPQAAPDRAPGARGSGTAYTEADRRGHRLISAAVVSAVILGGIAAAVTTRRDLAREAHNHQELVADQAGSLTEAMVQEVRAGLGGAQGLPDRDGEVDEDAFASLATGIATESPMSSVAFAATVPAAERDDLESSLGWPVIDEPEGDPAPERRRYHPIRWIAPASDASAPPIGLDVEEDPVLGPTARAARDTGRPLASAPSDRDPAGPGIVFVQALYRPGLPSGATVAQRREAHVGYVATVVPGDRLLAALLSQVDDRIDVRVSADDQLVAETEDPPEGGSSTTRDIAGRSWTITVESRNPGASAAPWWILAATAAVAAAVVALGRRTDRHQVDTARYIRQSERIAALGRSLAAASSVPELARVVDDQTPGVIGAMSVTFGLVDWRERRVERYFGPGAPGPEFARRYAVVALDDRMPVARCVRQGKPVVVETLDDWRAESSPEVTRDVEHAGLGTTVCWPIRDAGDTVVATLSVSWGREVSMSEPTRAALGTIAELVELTLARARLTDAQVADAHLDAELARLTSGLAAVGTADEAMAFLVEQLPRPLEAVHATVGLVEPGGVLRRCMGPHIDGRASARAITDLDAPLPLAEAVRTGTTIVIAGTEVLAEHWPEALEGWESSGFRSAADIALRGRDGRVIGGLGVAWDRTVAFDDDLMTRLTTLSGIVAQALERAQLSDAAQREATRTSRLAELAEAATAAGTTEHMAVTLASRASAVVGGAGGHVGLLTTDRRALRVIHHEAFEPHIGRRYAFQRLDQPLPLVVAVTTGEPVLLADLDDIAARAPAVHDDMVALGLRSLAVMPMSTEEGVPFGVLALTWTQPQRFDDNLRSTLRTVTDLCTTSLTRAWLTDRTAARTAALATLARHLSVARSFDDVSTAIASHAAPALDAQAAIVGLVEGDRFRLRIPGRVGDDLVAKYTDLPLDDDFPALEALRRNEIVTFASPNEVPPHQVVRDLADRGIRAGASAPLTTADGSPLGVLSVLWARPPTFDDALLARLATVADLAEQTAERARLFDAEHRITQDLQRRVIPRMPSVDGVVIAARYEPASVDVGMGGDWYDAVALDDDRICVVLGDVSGHGLGAIAEMTQIRVMVRTAAADGATLSEIVRRTSAQIRQEEGVYATLVVATVDTANGTLGYVTAGHPPPLLRRPDGTVEVLRHGRHPVLGVDLGQRPAGCAPFPPGSTLVAYTDGLIERPGTPIDASIDELARQLGAAPEMAPGDLADHLVSANPTGGDHTDDVALVVVERRA